MPYQAEDGWTNTHIKAKGGYDNGNINQIYTSGLGKLDAIFGKSKVAVGKYLEDKYKKKS